MASQTVYREEEAPFAYFHRWTIDHLTWFCGNHFNEKPAIQTKFMVKHDLWVNLTLFPMESRSINNTETKFVFKMRVYTDLYKYKYLNIFNVWIESNETTDYKRVESNSFCFLSFISPKFSEKASYTICVKGLMVLNNKLGDKSSESELDSHFANVSPTLTHFPFKPPSTFTIDKWEFYDPTSQLIKRIMQNEHTFALNQASKFNLQFKENSYDGQYISIELTECLTNKLLVWCHFSLNGEIDPNFCNVRVFTKNIPIKLKLKFYYLNYQTKLICEIMMMAIEYENIPKENIENYERIYRHLKPSFFEKNQTNVNLENTKTPININCEANLHANSAKRECKDDVIKDDFEETVHEFVKMDEKQLKKNIKTDTEFGSTGGNEKTEVADLEFLNQIILGFLQNSETKSELINSIFIHLSNYLPSIKSPFKVTTDFILQNVLFPTISTAFLGKFQIDESTFSSETMTKLSQFIEESLDIFQKMIDKWIDDILEATKNNEPKVFENDSNENQFVADKTDAILKVFLETKELQSVLKNLIFKEITKQRPLLDSTEHITTNYILNNVILTSDSTFTAGNINLNSSSVSEETLEKLKQFIDDSLKDIQEQLNKVAKIEEYLKEAQEKLNGINQIEKFLKQRATDLRYVVSSENVCIEEGAIKVTVKIEDNKSQGKFDMNLTIPIAHNEAISQPMITIENESENLRVAVINPINPKQFKKCLFSNGSSFSYDHQTIRMYAYFFTLCDLSQIKKQINQEELKSLELQVEQIQQKYSRISGNSNVNSDVTFLSSLLLRQIKAINQCVEGKIAKLLSIEHLKLGSS